MSDWFGWILYFVWNEKLGVRACAPKRPRRQPQRRGERHRDRQLLPPLPLPLLGEAAGGLRRLLHQALQQGELCGFEIWMRPLSASRPSITDPQPRRTYLHIPRRHGPHALGRNGRQVLALGPAEPSSSSSRHHHVQQRRQQVLLKAGVAERGGEEVPPEAGPEPADARVGAEEVGGEEHGLCVCVCVWVWGERGISVK